MMGRIKATKSRVTLSAGGELRGEPVITAEKHLGDIIEHFKDQKAARAMDPSTVLYSVEAFLPVEDGTPGGLFYGRSTVMPGDVGGELFFTKGHFHVKKECAEFYWGLSGTGLLLMMSEKREICAEIVEPGSLHYIPGFWAHRLVNTGETPLQVGACWPSDAGHEYDEITKNGFSARVFRSSQGFEIKEEL